MMVSQGNGKRFMSEINVTPFVDVMLVLLIIFMVTAPMMTQGVEVNLPQTIAKNIKAKEDPLILSINSKREIFLENTPVKLEDIESKMKSIFKYRREKDVLLRADRNIAYGFVIKVIARVKKAGINKLGMVTEPIEEKP